MVVMIVANMTIHASGPIENSKIVAIVSFIGSLLLWGKCRVEKLTRCEWDARAYPRFQLESLPAIGLVSSETEMDDTRLKKKVKG